MVTVAPENAEQAGAWNGDEGERWAANADRYDAALGRLAGRCVMHLLDHQSADLVRRV